MSGPRTQEERERLEAARASAAALNEMEGVQVDFEFLDPDEIVERIGENDAAVFITADAFGFFRPPGQPLQPAIDVTGPDWLVKYITAGRLQCRQYGIGNKIADVEVKLFAYFRFYVSTAAGDIDIPLYIWIDEAPEEWVQQALRRFAVVWPPAEEAGGERPWVATGPLNQFPEGMKVPPKLSRNDPCPCGSKLKFKRCHGK